MARTAFLRGLTGVEVGPGAVVEVVRLLDDEPEVPGVGPFVIRVAQRTALRRLGAPAEVAATVAFLRSAGAGYPDRADDLRRRRRTPVTGRHRWRPVLVPSRQLPSLLFGWAKPIVYP
jgi:NAD(P)-dependent dehydrogenase (short-subunit alcohol dehydrogenase family)